MNFWGILFPAAIISIIYAKEWGITDFIPWPALLTALLCSIGLSMIFKKSGRWTCFGHDWNHDWNHDWKKEWNQDQNHDWNHNNGVFSSNVVNEEDDSVVYCSANFGECMKYVNSNNFERANIKCSFGEVKVYFDNALIPSGKAEIYLDVSFGDAVLFIPKTWKIKNDVHIFLGDMGEKNKNIGSDSPVVTIHGNISFGDASIIYV